MRALHITTKGSFSMTTPMAAFPAPSSKILEDQEQEDNHEDQHQESTTDIHLSTSRLTRPRRFNNGGRVALLPGLVA